MLTKDLAKHTVRKDKVIPFSIKPNDDHARSEAMRVIAAFSDAVGKTEAEILQDLGDVPNGSKGLILSGLFKLQSDRCQFKELDESIKEFRWQLIERAQDIRESRVWSDVSEFEEVLADEFREDLSSMRDKIYSDLPQNKTLETVKLFEAEELVHRYNCAQVQFLLLRAEQLIVDLTSATKEELRLFHRQLKFHRLLCENLDARIFKLSGPLQMDMNAQRYGDRLSSFFPHILNISKFKVEALVKIGTKKLQMSLKDSVGIKSHYQKQSAYIPPEFAEIKESLEKKLNGAVVSMEGESVHIGFGENIVPDITVVQGKIKRHVELFHKWHQGSFEKLLKAAESNNIENVKFGLSRSIAKKPAMKALIEKSAWFQKNGFLFTDFPTPNQVAGVL